MKESCHGYCGIYCGACGAEDCGGCRSDRIDETITECRFRQCASGKGVEFCCFCREHPCEALQKFMHDEWPHHWTIKDNLEMIQRDGKEKWLAEQKAIWSCPECGAEIFWYFKKCSCGATLKAWELPESYKQK